MASSWPVLRRQDSKGIYVWEVSLEGACGLPGGFTDPPGARGSCGSVGGHVMGGFL